MLAFPEEISEQSFNIVWWESKIFVHVLFRKRYL